MKIFQVDVIVVSNSSHILLNNIFEVAGEAVVKRYNFESQKNPNASLISIEADTRLPAEIIYVIPWQSNSDTTVMCQSLRTFVSDAMKEAYSANYESIAFPALGCGLTRCSIRLVAQTMIKEAYDRLTECPISVVFIIRPERLDILDEFQKEIHQLQQSNQPSTIENISVNIGQGVIEIEKGDITTQEVRGERFVLHIILLLYRLMLLLEPHHLNTSRRQYSRQQVMKPNMCMTLNVRQIRLAH